MYTYNRGGFTNNEHWSTPNLKRKLPDRYFKPVLHRSAITTFFKASPKGDKIYITAPGYEAIEIPPGVVIQVCEKIHLSNKSIEDLLIEACINNAIFYHPIEELTFTI